MAYFEKIMSYQADNLRTHCRNPIAAPEIAGQCRWLVGGLLLADREMAGDPIHIAIARTD